MTASLSLTEPSLLVVPPTLDLSQVPLLPVLLLVEGHLQAARASSRQAR